ncbi:MAG: hypothetical protein ACOX7C_09140 [Brevefilum sp.]|jgi:hypothetical protein
MVKLQRFLGLGILLFMLSACAGERFAADQLPWVGDAPVLFKDDFSSQEAGWKTLEDSLSFIGYEDGGFRLMTSVPNYQFWSVPGLNFKDVQVYVQAQKIGGPDNNLFGVICRYQNPENFYAFLIGSDGYYGIFKMEKGQLGLIDQAHMSFDQAIHRGEATNELMAICEGDRLALLVNDHRLLQVQDDTLGFGDVGLLAGSLTSGGIDVLFDNLIVLKR